MSTPCQKRDVCEFIPVFGPGFAGQRPVSLSYSTPTRPERR
ncbi:hypothetical protein [Corynebacterium flavescens]